MKWLSFREGVVTTPEILRAAEAMDPYFENEPSVITSGLRSREKQLLIIEEKAKRHKIASLFQEYTPRAGLSPSLVVQVDGQEIYWWQRTWSKLLSIGDIVNPPIPAAVLFDYFRPGSPENRKGTVIDISPHQRGLALDIGGALNLQEKAKRVLRAHQEGKAFIHGFLIERINNAVHVDCVEA